MPQVIVTPKGQPDRIKFTDEEAFTLWRKGKFAMREDQVQRLYERLGVNWPPSDLRQILDRHSEGSLKRFHTRSDEAIHLWRQGEIKITEAMAEKVHTRHGMKWPPNDIEEIHQRHHAMTGARAFAKE